MPIASPADYIQVPGKVDILVAFQTFYTNFSSWAKAKTVLPFARIRITRGYLAIATVAMKDRRSSNSFWD